jgi:hypothetical protein
MGGLIRRKLEPIDIAFVLKTAGGSDGCLKVGTPLIRPVGTFSPSGEKDEGGGRFASVVGFLFDSRLICRR